MIKAIISTILFAFVLTASAQDFTEDELKLIASLVEPAIHVNWDCVKGCAKDALPCALKSTPLCLLRINPGSIAACVGAKCGIQGIGCLTHCFRR